MFEKNKPTIALDIYFLEEKEIDPAYNSKSIRIVENK